MDVIEILAFIVAIGLLLYRKVSVNQTQDKRPRKKRPVRPALDVGEKDKVEKVSETVIPVKEPTVIRPTSFHDATRKRKSVHPVSDPEKKASTVVPSITEVSGESIRFRNREDARRAFLYSEIFNRKYD